MARSSCLCGTLQMFGEVYDEYVSLRFVSRDVCKRKSENGFMGDGFVCVSIIETVYEPPGFVLCEMSIQFKMMSSCIFALNTPILSRI